MTLVVADALTPNKPNQTKLKVLCHIHWSWALHYNSLSVNWLHVIIMFPTVLVAILPGCFPGANTAIDSL